MQMTAEAKRARARYMREWRRAHPEKQREYDARKWQRIADRAAAEKEARKAAAANEHEPI
jgi:hypothetical protein